MAIVTPNRDLGPLGRGDARGSGSCMVVLWLIAAGLTGLALYKFGELRGAWTRWRASVGILRSRRSEALGLLSGLVLLVAGGALALSVIYVLFSHHLCCRYRGSEYRRTASLRPPAPRPPRPNRVPSPGRPAARRHDRAAHRASGLSSWPSLAPSRIPATSASRSARPPASLRSSATAAASSSPVSGRHLARWRAPCQLRYQDPVSLRALIGHVF